LNNSGWRKSFVGHIEKGTPVLCYYISRLKPIAQRKVFPMIRSIQQFEEVVIKKLEKIIESLMKDPKDMASFVYGVCDDVIALGLDIIKVTLEDCNQMLRDSTQRKQSWEEVFKKYIAKTKKEYPDKFKAENYTPHTI